jgi:hypothetical protein
MFLKERIIAYTVENDTLSTITFNADAKVVDDESRYVERYLNCMINEKAVSENEYIAQKDIYYQNSLSWLFIKENGENRNYERQDAVDFIQILAANAGIDENESLKLVS